MSSETVSLLGRPERRASRGSGVRETSLTTGSGGAASWTLSYEQVEFRRSEDSLTEAQAMMHLLKATVGTGALAMPRALATAGLVVGMAGLSCVALVSLHCMRLLVESTRSIRQQQMERQQEQQQLDYSTVAGLAFDLGPRRVRRYADWSRRLLNVFLLTNQFGLVAVYYLFVSENVQLFVSDLAGIDWPLLWFSALLLLAFLPYAFVRQMNVLAPLAMVANVCLCFSLACIVAFCCLELRDPATLPMAKGVQSLPLFLGLVLFSFESINLVLPIENRLVTKDAMIRRCGLLDVSVVLVIAMYTAVGFYGYLRYGEDVRESLTYSMPNTPWYMATLKLLYSFSIFVSYGLQYHLLAHIVCQWAERRVSRCWKPTELAIRIGIVLLSFLAPMIVPHLDLIIALVGGFSGSAIIFVYPPMLNSLALWRNIGPCRLTKNLLLMVFGMAALILSTYSAIAEIVVSFF